MRREARRADRIYEPPGVRLLVRGEAAALYSLSATGLGVFLPERSAFNVADQVRPLRLEGAEGSVDLAAEVVHITRGSVFFPDRASRREFYLFGLRFLFDDPDRQRRLQALIGRLAATPQGPSDAA